MSALVLTPNPRSSARVGARQQRAQSVQQAPGADRVPALSVPEVPGADCVPALPLDRSGQRSLSGIPVIRDERKSWVM